MSNRQLLCGHAAQLKEFNTVDKVKSCQLAWETKPALCYCLIYERRCCPQLMGALTGLTSSHAIHHLFSTTWNIEKLFHSLRLTIPYCFTLLSHTWSYPKPQVLPILSQFLPFQVRWLMFYSCFDCYHVLGSSILLNFNLICTHKGRLAVV